MPNFVFVAQVSDKHLPMTRALATFILIVVFLVLQTAALAQAAPNDPNLPSTLPAPNIPSPPETQPALDDPSVQGTQLAPVTLGPKTPAKQTSSSPAPRYLSPNGQEYWIDPDRPHISDSSVNVPKGLYLQENGFQQTYPGRGGVFDIPETLMRLGVLERTELRFNVPDYFLARSGGQTILSGVGDIQVGFKHRLMGIPGRFQLAVNPFMAVPTGTNGITIGRVEPMVRIPFSYELNKNWDIEGMESILFFGTQNHKANLDWQNALLLNRSWGRKYNAFIEYAGDVFEYGPMSNLIHFGAAYRPNRKNQLDCQFGFRLNNAAPIAFFGFGYSFLLGRLERP